MPRYARVQGPAADFELVSSWQTITGLALQPYHGNGPILILAHASIYNNCGADLANYIRVIRDGIALITFPPISNVPNSKYLHLAVTYLADPAPGGHTYALQAYGNVGAGDVVKANGAELTLIELPVWEQPFSASP